MPSSSTLRRVLVIGTTGSGKTTLARQLAAHLSVPHAEQDAWNHLPNWQEAPLEQFRAQVERFTAGEAWVMDGNYSKAQDIGWARADSVVWLDYSGGVVFWQLLQRTLRRMHRREELWNGNREDWRTLLKKDGILAWFLRTHWRNRRRMPQNIAAYPHLQLVRLSSPSECGRWLRALEAGPVSRAPASPLS